jgi:hypothetical protein
LRFALSFSLIVILLAVCFGVKGCGSKPAPGGGTVHVAVPYIETALRVAEKAVLIFETNNLSTGNLKKFISIGKPLVAAFKAGGTPLGQAAEFIDAWEMILVDVELIQNASTRTIVLVALFVADEAIHDLLDQIEIPTFAHALQGTQKDAVEKLKAFKAKPRLRCRASGPIEKYKAGQFAPMAICQKYPDQTQVERIKK